MKKLLFLLAILAFPAHAEMSRVNAEYNQRGYVNNIGCQCYLNADDRGGSFTVILSTKNGNLIQLGDRVMELPYKALEYPNSGLAASTVYHAYVCDIQGKPTPLLSTTYKKADEKTGIAVSRDNRKCNFMGSVKTLSDGTFGTVTGNNPSLIDQQWLVSWWIREPLTGQKTLASDTTITSTSWTPISGTEIGLLSLGYNHPVTIHGNVANTAKATVYIGVGVQRIGVDATACTNVYGSLPVSISVANQNFNFALATQVGLNEELSNAYAGEYKLSICGKTSAGTAKFIGGMQINTEIWG